MTKIEELFSNQPVFHAKETEIDRPFEAEESTLSAEATRELASPGLACHTIGPDVLAFIVETVKKGNQTLETGAGCSTLAFALGGASHIAITPSHDEARRILEYGQEHQIDLSAVKFVIESSDRYLPRCESQDLDIVLLDGKHAFPWPMVDWFYTAEKLCLGGIMLIDDLSMRSVAVLADFMRTDPGWELLHDFSAKTLAFRKTRASTHDVAWHMQPWTTMDAGYRPTMIQRIGRFARRSLNPAHR
jgi:predicted O-methyltransferase YrrM